MHPFLPTRWSAKRFWQTNLLEHKDRLPSLLFEAKTILMGQVAKAEESALSGGDNNPMANVSPTAEETTPNSQVTDKGSRKGNPRHPRDWSGSAQQWRQGDHDTSNDNADVHDTTQASKRKRYHDTHDNQWEWDHDGNYGECQCNRNRASKTCWSSNGAPHWYVHPIIIKSFSIICLKA